MSVPESVLAQASWSWAHKAEWQRVWDDQHVHDRGRQALRVRLADGAAGRSGAAAPAPGHGDGPPQRRGVVSRRSTGHRRSRSSDGSRRPRSDCPPLRARPGRQPRHQGGVRVPDRQQPVWIERQLRTHPVPRRQHEPVGHSMWTGSCSSACRPREQITADNRNRHHALFVQDTWRPVGLADAEPGRSGTSSSAPIFSMRSPTPFLDRVVPQSGLPRRDGPTSCGTRGRHAWD